MNDRFSHRPIDNSVYANNEMDKYLPIGLPSTRTQLTPHFSQGTQLQQQMPRPFSVFPQFTPYLLPTLPDASQRLKSLMSLLKNCTNDRIFQLSGDNRYRRDIVKCLDTLTYYNSPYFYHINNDEATKLLIQRAIKWLNETEYIDRPLYYNDKNGNANPDSYNYTNKNILCHTSTTITTQTTLQKSSIPPAMTATNLSQKNTNSIAVAKASASSITFTKTNSVYSNTLRDSSKSYTTQTTLRTTPTPPANVVRKLTQNTSNSDTVAQNLICTGGTVVAANTNTGYKNVSCQTSKMNTTQTKLQKESTSPAITITKPSQNIINSKTVVNVPAMSVTVTKTSLDNATTLFDASKSYPTQPILRTTQIPTTTTIVKFNQNTPNSVTVAKIPICIGQNVPVANTKTGPKNVLCHSSKLDTTNTLQKSSIVPARSIVDPRSTMTNSIAVHTVPIGSGTNSKTSNDYGTTLCRALKSSTTQSTLTTTSISPAITVGKLNQKVTNYAVVAQIPTNNPNAVAANVVPVALITNSKSNKGYSTTLCDASKSITAQTTRRTTLIAPETTVTIHCQNITKSVTVAQSSNIRGWVADSNTNAVYGTTLCDASKESNNTQSTLPPTPVTLAVTVRTRNQNTVNSVAVAKAPVSSVIVANTDVSKNCITPPSTDITNFMLNTKEQKYLSKIKARYCI
jgi:hypothetical protein